MKEERKNERTGNILMPEIDRWFDIGDAIVVNENGVEWMRPKEGNGEIIIIIMLFR